METNIILQGDCLTQLKTLSDESINCCMTSPPYWALRDYGVPGQLGLEPTFQEYINKLCDIFDEVKRVLRKDGTLWVNIGDTYCGGNGSAGHTENTKNLGYNTLSMGAVNKTKLKKCREDCKQLDIKFNTSKKFCNNCGKEFDCMPGQYFCGSACSGVDNTRRELKGELPDKTLCNIPARFSIEMQNRGWILRNVIIWHKPNCMPSSVKDRFTVDFEYLFFFVKSKKYWFETIYENFKECTIKRYEHGRVYNSKDADGSNAGFSIAQRENLMKRGLERNGRNKRTVWTITTKPFKEAHFATYPEALCETPIKAGCPEFVCNKCGKAREKIVEKIYKGATKSGYSDGYGQGKHLDIPNKTIRGKELGYSNCGCNAGFSGGIVLDPFFGAGTTGLVALKQNKKFIGIELNPKYIEIAMNRLKPFMEQKIL